MRRRASGLAPSNPSISVISDVMQIEPATEALRLLAGCTSTSSDTNDILGTLYNDLKDITIEMRDHESVDGLMQQRGPFVLEQMSLFVRYFVYLSSNNLLDSERIDKLVEWMVKSKTQWLLEPLLDLRTPSTEIFGSKIFVSAAKLGEVEVVRSLIARGIDVDASAGPGRTALAQAVRWHHPRVVELLLVRGAELNTKLTSEMSILVDALKGPHTVEMLTMLFDKCVDINAVEGGDGSLKPFLPLAVARGDHRIIPFLVEAGAEIDAYDADLGTALQLAVAREDVEAVQFLIDAGADIEGPAGDFDFEEAWIAENYHLLRTPIQQASLAGKTEIVQILVNEGADVNAFQWEGYDYNTRFPWKEYRTHHWNSYDEFEDTPYYEEIMMTPLQAAVFKRDPVMVRILLAAGACIDEKGHGDTPLQMAAALDDAKLVHILRRHGADVNAPAANDGGMTALQAAARAGSCKVVQEMLVSGSEINAVANPIGGRTALQAAAESGNVELAKILIEAGANVNADASLINGRTCLQAAAEHKHVDMVLMLLNAGADVNGSAAETSGGLTAVQAALWPFDDNYEESYIKDDDKEPDVSRNEQYQDTILQALLDAGADLTALSSPQGSMIPIVVAVDAGRPELVRLCLHGGADPNMSVGWKTALGAAVNLESAELVILLIERGADVNACCEMYYPTPPYGSLRLWSALHVAAAKGNIDIANILLQAGAAINMLHESKTSSSVLQCAIASNSVRMVQFLLNNGASFHALGPEWCPSNWAVLHGFVGGMQILNALAVAGEDFKWIAQTCELDFDRQDMQKLLDSGSLMYWTAEQKGYLLQQAGIKQGYSDLIQGMLDAGADVNTPPVYSYGRTALQRAAEQGYTDVITLLLSHGADVNAPAARSGGIIALQGAALNGNLKIVLTLLQAGAEINAAPAVTCGRTALQAAAEHGRLDIVSLLLENDHDMEEMTLRCEDAADLAEGEGHKVIAQILREYKAGQIST